MTAVLRGPRRFVLSWAALVLSATAGVLVLAWTGGPLRDPDLWWHIRTGRLILDTHRIPHTDPWSFTAPPEGWVPTAWLSDAGFAGVWRLGGDDALRAMRVVLAAAVISAIWALASRFAADTTSAALTCALAVVSVGPFLRERPQVISFLFVAWLALLVQRVLAGVRPPLLLSVVTTYLWANLHGMWILLPVALLGAAVLSYHEDRTQIPLVARCTTIAVLGTASTALTPVGPRLTAWPLVVQRAAAPITEWQPTVPIGSLAWAFTAMLVIVVARWCTGEVRPTRTQLLYVGAVTAFALLAYRNLAPATILLVPEVARSLPALGALSRRSGATLAALTLAVGLTLAGMRFASTPTVSPTLPTAIAAELATRSGELRVLNDYDVGGLLTGTASPPVRVAIDGRTDLWSSAFVREYVETLRAQRDWRPLVDRLRPDAALLLTDSEVARGLTIERNWITTLTDGDWSLLEPRR